MKENRGVYGCKPGWLGEEYMVVNQVG